jgi:hypothetical protein
MMSSYQSYEEFKELQRLHRDNAEQDEDGRKRMADLRRWIVSREKNRFHGLLLLALGGFSQACKRQLFFTTSAARFHGLSRLGVSQLAQLGYMQKMTLFDKQAKEANVEALETIRSALKLYILSTPTQL